MREWWLAGCERDVVPRALLLASGGIALPSGSRMMPPRQPQRGKRPRAPGFEYESETDLRVSRGSVAVADGVLWLGEITVSMDGERAIIQIERSPGDAEPSDAALAVPFEEVDAVLTLLTGVVDQARRSGVLPAPLAPTRDGASNPTKD